MFTDDESGDYDRDSRKDSEPSLAHISRKRLLATLAVSFVSMLFVLYLVLGGGTAAAVVSGAGGFYAEFDKIDANGAYIYPTVTETASCQSDVETADGRPEEGDTALPVLRVDLQGAEIPDGNMVRFIKTINTPSLMGIDTFSVVVRQGDNPGATELDDTTVLVTGLEGESLGLGETVANESYTEPAGDNPGPQREIFGPSTPSYFENNGLDKNMSVLGEFAIKGETGEVTNGEGVAHFVSFESLSIPDLNVSVVYDQHDEYAPSGDCPVN